MHFSAQISAAVDAVCLGDTQLRRDFIARGLKDWQIDNGHVHLPPHEMAIEFVLYIFRGETHNDAETFFPALGVLSALTVAARPRIRVARADGARLMPEALAFARRQPKPTIGEWRAMLTEFVHVIPL